MDGKKALVIIDMQEGYLEKYKDEAARILNRVNEAIRQAKENGEPVIYIQNKRVAKGKSVFSKFEKGLDIASAYIYHKEKASIFSNEALVRVLKEMGVTTLELAGIDGNCCIAHSAIEGRHLGYEISLKRERIGVKNANRFQATVQKLMQAGVMVS